KQGLITHHIDLLETRRTQDPNDNTKTIGFMVFASFSHQQPRNSRRESSFHIPFKCTGFFNSFTESLKVRRAALSPTVSWYLLGIPILFSFTSEYFNFSKEKTIKVI